ncbi:hypothetical protein niasHS_001565 [Heterodera schachtii]|uniref:Potassium channel domain-containing protein n=1 Tax=Heterodera schachtii TaxID=97005 RepID=A0ABD2KDT2_HETSC
MTPKGSVGSFVVGRSNIDLETNTNNNYSYSNNANLVTTAIGNGKMPQGMADEGEEQATAQLSNREEFHLHNLLENVDQMGTEHDSSWRKYARLVLPHIGLVIFVCLYAMFGAWVFYSIESPHEDRLKLVGIQRVYQMRQSLINGLISRRRKSGESDQKEGWKDGMEQQLNTFSEMLFKSYKENYVRYENVRFTNVHALQQLNAPHQSQMDSRFRRHFSKSRSDGKLWTPSSSLFFAATTMATIGYGNIVPVTSHGRIACIIFALFGAPLTIITIGDLGKFLSECTIWLYRRLKDKFYYFRYTFTVFWLARRRKRRRRQSKKSLVFSKDGDFGGREFGGDEADEGEEEEEEGEDEAERRARAQLQRLKLKSIKSVDEWDEQEENTEVPVLLVFAILLLYIAAGGLLFAIMESWTYMDAFYYCFVSLTTIGFGDLVPDRHEYIALMLIYLGVGLAVTTMCIDLVGIQYIQKIHYFGRKFKGTDILQILRRKRMLERRFAMGEGKELIEYVIKQEREALFPSHQPRGLAQPAFHLANQAHARDQTEDEKISLRSEQQEMVPTEEAQVQEILPIHDLALARAMDIPRILEPATPIERRKLSTPTIETPSSESERLIMYAQQRHGVRADSWAESGPTPSVPSSTPSTAPSVRQRELIYEQFRSPQPSLTSFAFTFPPPSPNLRQIAEAARSARRLASCPLLPFASVSAFASPPPRRKWRTLACPSHALAELLRFARPRFVIVPLLESLSRKISSSSSPSPRGPAQLGKCPPGGARRPKDPPKGENSRRNSDDAEAEAAQQQRRHHALELTHEAEPVEQQQLRYKLLRPAADDVQQAPKAPSLIHRFRCQPVWYYRRRRSLLMAEAHAAAAAVPGADSHHQRLRGDSASSSAAQALTAAAPILKRKRRERHARRYDPLQRMDWLALSPRIAIAEDGMPMASQELDELTLHSKALPPLLLDNHPAYNALMMHSQRQHVGSSSFCTTLPPSGCSTAREAASRRHSPEHRLANTSLSRYGSVAEQQQLVNSSDRWRRGDEKKATRKWKEMALRARFKTNLMENSAETIRRPLAATTTPTSSRRSLTINALATTTTNGALKISKVKREEEKEGTRKTARSSSTTTETINSSSTRSGKLPGTPQRNWKMGATSSSAEVFPFPPAVPLVRAVELPPLSLPRPPPSPSPPPPEPTPVPEMPMPKMAEQLELVVEDPHHTQPTLPPISRAAVMFEQIDELATDASVQSKVAQRLAPHQIASELLAISGSELRHLSPEQFVMEQQHLLLSDAFQGSVSESAAAESAAGSIEEAQKLYNLAAIEQQPNIVGTAHHTLTDSPMPYDLEEYGAMEEVGEEEEEGEQSMFDIDLGAFELVDSAITAEELLTNEDPVIYHKDLPVHSVHHDTVQTEAAIENLMNASPSMLSTQVPPTMVADNYCFAVDGDRIQMADILGDEQWWKHTSRPTKYFYSKDLRRFYRVQCLAVRGRVVSARLANTTPAMGGGADDALAAELQQAISAAGDSFSVPSSLAFRRSITFAGGGRASLASVPPTSSDSATSAPLSSASHFQQQQQMLRRFGPDAQRGETVDLGDVYRVVRFYSFWRTCTSFHRIVTMIERIGQGSGAVVAAPTDQRRSPSRARNSGAGIAEQWCPPSQQQLHPRASTSSAATGGSEPTSSMARGDAFGGRSPRGLPDFQKRLFVQYLWRNAKPSDKARVQREFDPRRQRLLKYVTDTAARKRMTSAKVQWRSGSAGTSTDKATKWRSLQTPPGSATAPTFSPSAPSVRWRLPPGASASAGAPSPNRSPTHSASPFAAARRRPHSAVSASLRRTRTSADMRPKK